VGKKKLNLNFASPGAVNAGVLNKILWRDCERHLPMPAPKHTVLLQSRAARQLAIATLDELRQRRWACPSELQLKRIGRCGKSPIGGAEIGPASPHLFADELATAFDVVDHAPQIGHR
jgi:hypothetical protein